MKISPNTLPSIVGTLPRGINLAARAKGFDDNERMLNEFEVANMTGLTVSTLRQWRVSGSKLPFVKLGRRVVYKKDDVTDYIAANTFRSTTEAEQAAK